MSLKLIFKEVQRTFNEFEKAIFILINKYPPHDNLCWQFNEVNSNSVEQDNKPFFSFLKDSILWAAPTSRATIERRWKRRYGSLDGFCKTLIPRKDLLICNHCGHDFQRGHLCPFCYNKIKLETEAMQDAIEKELGLDPVDQEVIVLYENEKEEPSSEYWKGKRIVELTKVRPPWFSRNLLQGSTVGPSESTDLKPENLA